jgi:glycosyltransferase involved in cell wall biosynthesis
MSTFQPISMSSGVSALVRTWNSERTLKLALRALRKQRPVLDEIIVVDSGSTDTTLDIARSFDCRIIRYPTGKEFNYSVALNLGIESVQGEYCLILSSHNVLLFENVVEIMLKTIEGAAVAAVYCTTAHKGGDFLHRSASLRGRLVDIIYKDTFDGTNGLWNACSLGRTSVFRESPFCESTPTAEDQIWAARQYERFSRPTARIRMAGVLSLNPYHTTKKDAFETAIVASRLFPDRLATRMLAKRFASAIVEFLAGNAKGAFCELGMFREMLRFRFRRCKVSSRYHLGKRA